MQVRVSMAPPSHSGAVYQIENIGKSLAELQPCCQPLVHLQTCSPSPTSTPESSELQAGTRSWICMYNTYVTTSIPLEAALQLAFGVTVLPSSRSSRGRTARACQVAGHLHTCSMPTYMYATYFLRALHMLASCTWDQTLDQPVPVGKPPPTKYIFLVFLSVEPRRYWIR